MNTVVETESKLAKHSADNSSAPLALGSEDVVLVSGGGKGITFEMVSELARAKHCKLALLGSSPLPADGGANQNELLRNLARLKKEGIAHAYVQADVTDLEAVRRAVTEAERQLGRITGIFHGAGITQLRSFREKLLDDFLRCIRIKARGLYNLLAAVPPVRLKMLHATSSVLGNTGMRGQTDYTFANAWLDEAVRSVKAAHPHIHCLSLGYSVWAETGLGKKIGALESLRAVGVTPVSVKEGVSAYRHLLDAPQTGSKFVITGRLTSDLEANLYPYPQPPRGRFLETVRRWIPGTEIVADANISHATDLYLPEHVFEGTPMFPGVMAIEAMVQAAMACAGREDLPVLRNIFFRRPLIVPEDAAVVVRTLALVDPTEGETVCVRVAMRSNGDDFQQNHFEAECWFGTASPDIGDLPVLPVLPEPLDHNPEDFSPVPFFQGKFFRRIVAFRKMENNGDNATTLTDLVVPDGERYYNHSLDRLVRTPSPALRDAFLQSGAVIVPSGSLPEMIKELRFHLNPTPATRLHCHVTAVKHGERGYMVDYSVFSPEGNLVETMTGLALQLPTAGSRTQAKRSPAPISISRFGKDLKELCPHLPHAIAMVEHKELINSELPPELSHSEIERLRTEVPEPRQLSALANLAAARRAVVNYCAQQHGLTIVPSAFGLTHAPDGKPAIQFHDLALKVTLGGIEISLADGQEHSIAVVAALPVGVDIEVVENRDAETWHGLLGGARQNSSVRQLAPSNRCWPREH